MIRRILHPFFSLRFFSGVISSCLFCVSCTVALVSGQDLGPEYLSEFRWRSLGPSATGGRVVDIEVDPRDNSKIFVASASGGLWRSENHGTTWTALFEKEGTISIGDIAIDPSHPDTIWVGTGEANNQRSSFWGDGIYRSNDGGKTWTNTGLHDSHHIGRVVVDPHDSKIVYVAALGHLYTSNEQRGLFKTKDGGTTWEKILYVNENVGVVDVVIDPENSDIIYAASYQRLRHAWNFDGAGPGSAIYKSVDGGATWKQLRKGLPAGNIGRIGLDIYPRDPSIVYATISNQNRTEQSDGSLKIEATEGDEIKVGIGIEFVFDDDGVVVGKVERNSIGQRVGFQRDDRVESIAEVTIADKDDLIETLESLRLGDRVQVVIERNGNRRNLRLTIPERITREVGGEVYRSDNGGKLWKKQNKGAVGGQPAYYYGQIRIDPNDDQRLYLLGISLYTSDDGGKSWKSDAARSVHVDHHALWINPANSNHILLGNDGGFHISYDRAKTWDYVFNLPLAQFYAIGVDMQQPYHVYGGLQDNGSFGGPSRTRSAAGIGRFDWHRVGGGDGFYVQVDPKDPDIVFAESQFGALGRLDRRTGRRTAIRPPQSDPTRSRDRYNWNSPLVMSAHDSRVIYFGGNKLFKSYNRGDDWQVISPDLTTADPYKIVGNVPHCTITTISESSRNKNELLVGTDDGNVQWTTDGGKTWKNVAQGFPIEASNWWCTRVELSHHADQTAYVTFSAFREDDFRPFVFVTRDGGQTWSTLAHGLPSGPVNVIREDRKNPDLLYLGTEFAVHVSFDAGANWTPLQSDLARVSVQDLLVHPRDHDLIVGTHGRGIYIIDDITPLQAITKELMKEEVHLFEPRPTIRWISKSGQKISGDRRLMTPNPSDGVILTYYLQSEVSDEDLKLEVRDEKGGRVALLKVSTKPGLHRVIWNLARSRRGSSSNSPDQSKTYRAVLTCKETVQEQMISLLADPLLDD